MIAIIPFICALVGLLLYVLVTNPKIAEIGRLVFGCAFLVLMFTLATHTVKFMAK